jgi:RNA polymerase sigma-70 factor (ECF subfamily)
MVMQTVTHTQSNFSRQVIASREGARTSARQGLIISLQTSDEALIKSIATGDKRAMQVLYTRHNVRVYRFALRVTHNSSSAEDVVSEVFLDVWRQAGQFEAKSHVTTWLLSIARNKALSALRRRPDQLDDNVGDTIEDTADDPETSTIKMNRGAIVRKCLSQLSVAHREVVDLIYYHEKSIDEVAHILELPANTVKTRMFYARKHLAEILSHAGVKTTH